MTIFILFIYIMLTNYFLNCIIVYNLKQKGRSVLIMIEISSSTNLLEQKSYKYSLQDVTEPNLYREIYPYNEIPKVAFNHRRVPIGMPKEIWITDTSFRDGMQSQVPYTPEQILHLQA